MDLIQTPEIQRLRRIRQLGVGYLVFPGAEHTRFGHALGAMALMNEALQNLAQKGTEISHEEQLAAMAAALIHDIGHGPFSHTLEHEFIADFRHEAMSRRLAERLNRRFDGALDLTLKMFDGTYERPFFHQLISSQLDMDRLDYLRRDSFYTGVSEGVIGVERIIKTMRVHPTPGGKDSEIVIEGKGIYAIENFLISRRLMYWQVYLHKTVLAGDHLLRAIFDRVRAHLAGRLHNAQPESVSDVSANLLFFLKEKRSADDIQESEVCNQYVQLDDVEVLYSIKQWMTAPDPVLADLARRFIHRDFFRVRYLDTPPDEERWNEWQNRVADWLETSGICSDRRTAEEAVPYYLTTDYSSHSSYENVEDSIRILDRDESTRELSEMKEAPAVTGLTQSVEKPYVCGPKPVNIAESS